MTAAGLVGLGAVLPIGAFEVARMATIWHFVRSLAPRPSMPWPRPMRVSL